MITLRRLICGVWGAFLRKCFSGNPSWKARVPRNSCRSLRRRSVLRDSRILTRFPKAGKDFWRNWHTARAMDSCMQFLARWKSWRWICWKNYWLSTLPTESELPRPSNTLTSRTYMTKKTNPRQYPSLHAILSLSRIIWTPSSWRTFYMKRFWLTIIKNSPRNTKKSERPTRALFLTFWSIATRKIATRMLTKAKSKLMILNDSFFFL